MSSTLLLTKISGLVTDKKRALSVKKWPTYDA